MKTWIKSVALVCFYAGAATIACAQDAAQYFTASQEFERLVSQTTADHRMPRISDKKAAELIATLSDSRRFLDSTTYQVKDLGPLTEMCGKANVAVMSYALFDVKNNIDPNANAKGVAVQGARLVEKNVQTFQDELERLQPFLFRCMAKQITLLTEYMLSLKPEELTDTRLAGLRQMRSGIFESYYGVLQIANNSALKDSYRIKVLQAIGDTATQYASILQPPARRQIVDLAKSSLPTAPNALQESLGKIVNAMTQARCDGLCRY
jgi:hypothetical protein